MHIPNVLVSPYPSSSVLFPFCCLIPFLHFNTCEAALCLLVHVHTWDILKHFIALTASLFPCDWLFGLVGSCNCKMGSSWKATVLLTWLLAAESVHGLPQSQPIGSVAESILEQTATEPSTAFKTQYPPSNSEARVLIPEASPVRFMINRQELSIRC